MALVLVGCQPTPTELEQAPDPLTLLNAAADKIRAADTFRLAVDVSGLPHTFYAELGDDGLVSAEFLQARAQYVSPDVFIGKVRIKYVVPLDVEVYANGTEQSYRLGNLNWIKGQFAPEFTPSMLLAEDTGFQAALTTMQNLAYIGVETLEDGQPVYHLTGEANGTQISSLVVGLINTQEELPLDVYVHRETGYPVRLVMHLPNGEGESTFLIDVYDINRPADITTPPTEGA
jgi:hypothetical protein